MIKERFMKTMKKPRVLITYVESGMGHIVSAKAICDALYNGYGNNIDIIEKHILRDSEKKILKDFEVYLTNEVKRHSILPGYCALQLSSMHLFGSKNTLNFVHSTIFSKFTNALIDEYRNINPDVIVCTHYFTLHVAVRYRDKYSKNTIVINYCPDNNVHGWWDNRADRFYTNNPLATKDAIKNKFKDYQLVEVFYPTRDSVTNVNESQSYYREKFGISQNDFAIVISNGLYAGKKTKKICHELFKCNFPITICVLAGHDKEIKEYFDNLIGKIKDNITIKTFGYMDNAPELYAACDLFITKGGPNAILDSVMVGTPILVDFCASPIEQKTTNLFVSEKKCGYYITNIKKIRQKVEELIQNPSLFFPLKENMKYFDKNKNGAINIADDIMNLVCSKFDIHQDTEILI